MKEHTRSVNKTYPVIRYRDETDSGSCPYGETTRIITGGLGGIANVHVISVTRGDVHLHKGYNEVYYVLSGNGHIMLDRKSHPLRPGAVVVIPGGVSHSLSADEGERLEFVIFGTPAMSVDDPRFVPIMPD
jgi:mannose-6-phosphate isomerase-like protein (cupin superfamily)